MAFDFNTLVYDRTAADVAQKNDKGTYNATDLNRVTAALEELDTELRSYGYSTGYRRLEVPHNAPTEINDPYTWYKEDIPTASLMDAYLDNVSAIRAVIELPPSTPQVPPDMNALTFSEANDIERILLDVEQLINNIIQSWYYSGEIYAGEV